MAHSHAWWEFYLPEYLRIPVIFMHEEPGFGNKTSKPNQTETKTKNKNQYWENKAQKVIYLRKYFYFFCILFLNISFFITGTCSLNSWLRRKHSLAANRNLLIWDNVIGKEVTQKECGAWQMCFHLLLKLTFLPSNQLHGLSRAWQILGDQLILTLVSCSHSWLRSGTPGWNDFSLSSEGGCTDWMFVLLPILYILEGGNLGRLWGC